MTSVADWPTPSKLAYALDAIARGLPVFPQRGKRPLIRAWPTNATLKPSTATRWWTRWPDADIGIALPPDIYVLDADTPDAMDNLYELEETYGRKFAETLTVRTARGEHRYFRVPHELARMPGGGAGIHAVEGKGSPGPVTWAGSVHPSGHVYAVTFDAPIAKMHGKLVAEIGPKRDQTRAGEATDEERERWAAAVAELLRNLRAGENDYAGEQRIASVADLRGQLRLLRLDLPELPTGWADRAFRAGAYLGPHVASGGLGLDETQEALVQVFKECDTQEGPNDHILRSIARGLATGARSAEL
jgi:hypothetical protein